MTTGIMMIPSELWLIIFKYMDTECYNVISDVLREIDANLSSNLFSIMCKDVVRKYPKIKLMNGLLFNSQFYRNRKEYLSARLIMISDYPIYEKKKRYNTVENKSYKRYIMENINSLTDDKRTKTIFENHTNYLDRIEIPEDTYVCCLKYYNISISICDIVNSFATNY